MKTTSWSRSKELLSLAAGMAGQELKRGVSSRSVRVRAGAEGI